MDGEIIARVERRRQWTPQEKAALLAEVEASEPNSNHHSLSYDLPRTELDRVGRRTQICAATSFLAPSCSSFPFSKPPIPACARSETSARVLQGCGFGYAHMLGTNADPNQPGRNATQNRKNLAELEE